jgi:hypothetical protein
MKTILKVLGINYSDIARRAGISPAAVTVSMRTERGRGWETARRMIEEARFDPKTEEAVRRAIRELTDYLT